MQLYPMAFFFGKNFDFFEVFEKYRFGAQKTFVEHKKKHLLSNEAVYVSGHADVSWFRHTVCVCAFSTDWLHVASMDVVGPLKFRLHISRRLYCSVGITRAAFLHDFPRLWSWFLFSRFHVRKNFELDHTPPHCNHVRNANKLEHWSSTTPCTHRKHRTEWLWLGGNNLPHHHTISEFISQETVDVEGHSTPNPFFRFGADINMVCSNATALRASPR